MLSDIQAENLHHGRVTSKNRPVVALFELQMPANFIHFVPSRPHVSSVTFFSKKKNNNLVKRQQQIFDFVVLQSYLKCCTLVP